MAIVEIAKYNIGQLVRHNVVGSACLVTDVDAVFAGDEAWYEAIPAERRPKRNQPFYRVQVEGDGEPVFAYVPEQNLVADEDGAAASSVITAAAVMASGAAGHAVH